MNWIVMAAILAYFLIGLAIEAWLDGVDAPFNVSTFVVWFLWPIVLIALGIALLFSCRRKKK